MILSLGVYYYRTDTQGQDNNRSEAVVDKTHLSNQDVQSQTAGAVADEPPSKKRRILKPNTSTVVLSDVLLKELQWKPAPQSAPQSESSSSATSPDSSPTTSSDSYQIDAMETTVKWGDCCHVTFHSVFDY